MTLTECRFNLNPVVLLRIYTIQGLLLGIVLRGTYFVILINSISNDATVLLDFVHFNIVTNSCSLSLSLSTPVSLQKIEKPFLSAVETTLGDRYTENVEGIYKMTIKFIIQTLVDGFEKSSSANNHHGTTTTTGTASASATTAAANNNSNSNSKS